MPLENQGRFWIGALLCILGWIFLGWGFVLFPLSIFFLFHAQTQNMLFAPLIVLNITGFITSLYLVGERIITIYF